jgi:PAT family acetyl-CoA transporter-like MFS transporter 1
MPTPAGNSPSYSAPAFPSVIETRRQYNHHSRSPSQPELELQSFSPVASSSDRSRKGRPLPPPLFTGARTSISQTPENAALLHDLPSASTSAFESESDNDTQMSKRAGKKTNRSSVIAKSSTDSLGDDGHANTTSTMNNVLEQRRKHASIDDPSPASQAASLMGRSSFNLDDAVPALDKSKEGPSNGFFDLSKKDQSNFLLLVLLYFLQGIPMGLAGGSVPFLLKSAVSYSAIGVFSLAAYPYSLKLLWSPIVDAVWTPKVGRRKSWILPIQILSGFSMLWLSSRVMKMMEQAGEMGSNGIWNFTFWWFALVFLCATQDIAVDGEAPARHFQSSAK